MALLDQYFDILTKIFITNVRFQSETFKKMLDVKV